MKLFFSQNIKKDNIYLDYQEAKHCLQVNRFKKNDQINIIDGKGCLYLCDIINDSVKNCILRIKKTKTIKAPKYKLHLAITPLKNPSKFDFFIQKSSEIGIDKITPIITEFSEKKTINLERCKKIMISAIKQSNNYFLPKINKIQNFNNFIINNKNQNIYISHCKKKHANKKIYDIKSKKTTILIGPEGGFSTNEIDFAMKNKIKEINIGNNILRTETIGIFYCALTKSLNDEIL